MYQLVIYKNMSIHIIKILPIHFNDYLKISLKKDFYTLKFNVCRRTKLYCFSHIFSNEHTPEPHINLAIIIIKNIWLPWTCFGGPMVSVPAYWWNGHGFESWSVQRSSFLSKNINRQLLCLDRHTKVWDPGLTIACKHTFYISNKCNNKVNRTSVLYSTWSPPEYHP